MTARVAELWRHPIKSLGREQVSQVTLVAGQAMQGDRIWAVSHEKSRAEPGAWARCGNFLRVAHSPQLAAVTAETKGARVVLRHPERPDLTVDPDADGAALVAWAAPLVAEGQRAPTKPHRADQALTDSDIPGLSIASLASHRAVAEALGSDLSHLRWRSNLFLDGPAPWAEFDWIGQELRIGGATLRIEARIGRCQNVQANPETGQRDLDVLGALATFGHSDFSVEAVVTTGGLVREGDPVALP